MGMRYAGFMASAREDRLLREEREAADAVREETYQRQIERDEAAHQRQLELLDIRQKNALKLAGISASRAQAAKDKALRKKVDAFIKVNNLPDTPAVRSEVSAGMDLLEPDKFIAGFKSGEIRLNNTGSSNLNPNADPESSSEFPVGTPVERVEAPTVDMTSSDATAPAIRLSTKDEDPVDSQMSDMVSQPTLPAEPEPATTASTAQQTEFALGTPVSDEPTEAEQEQQSLLSFGNNPYIKVEDYAGLNSAQLEQQIRILSTKGYSDEELEPLKGELEFVKQAENAEKGGFSSLIGEADSFGKLNALQASLDAQLQTGELDQDEFDKNSGLVMKATERLIETNRANAEKDGGQLMFFPFTGTGMIGADGQLLSVKDGKYYNAAGQEVDINNGRLLPPDGYETFIRNYNNSAQKIATDIDQGVGAVQALTDYRNLVITAPQGLNTYISVAGKLVSEVNSISSAFQGVVDGQYSYETFENNVMSAIRDLSADDRRIARLQLRAAYAMAAFSGSTGQALSDRELMMNLENIGQGITDPKKVVGLLNDALSEVVTRTEQKRSTKFDSFIATDDLKATMSDTPIGMDFKTYLYNRDNPIIDDRTVIALDEALKGQTEYTYKAVEDQASGDYTLKDIPRMTFQQFQEWTKTKPYDPSNPDAGTLYDRYSEDDLRDFFKQQGGKL